MIYIFESEAEALAIPNPKSICNKITHWLVYTEPDIPDSDKPQPISISAAQFRMALTHSNLRAQVEAAVAASASQDLKDMYEYSSTFESNNPHVLLLAESLGVTLEQIYAVFNLGLHI